MKNDGMLLFLITHLNQQKKMIMVMPFMVLVHVFSIMLLRIKVMK